MVTARAVHGLQGKDATVLGLGGKHVVAIVLPVAGELPQRAVHDVGGVDLDVAGRFLAGAHVLDEGLEDAPALEMPEDGAGRAVLEVEEVELLTEPPMIAFLGLFEQGQIGLERLLVGPGGAVDALQLLVARIAPPIGSGHFGELEGFELVGGGDVRTAAQVDEATLPVEGNGLPFGNGGDDLGLVVLPEGFEEFDRLVARPLLTHHGDGLGGELAHAGFDLLQILGGERTVVGEVVVEAVFDHRADGHLGLGKELLDGVREQMRG